MMDEFKKKEIKAGWEKRNLRKQEREKARREQAWKCAENAATLLKEKYGLKKVWLFGSLVYGKHFTTHSDIDLYVEGFPTKADYWEILSQAEYAAAPYPLNLILEEDDLPGLKEKISQEGILL